MIAMMLIVFMVLLLLGVPVAFSLGIPTMIYFFLNQGTIPIEFMAHTMTNPLFNYVLIALPAFLLSGRMMNGAGVTERIFNLAKALVGRFRGGLVYTKSSQACSSPPCPAPLSAMQADSVQLRSI